MITAQPETHTPHQVFTDLDSTECGLHAYVTSVAPAVAEHVYHLGSGKTARLYLPVRQASSDNSPATWR